MGEVLNQKSQLANLIKESDRVESSFTTGVTVFSPVWARVLCSAEAVSEQGWGKTPQAAVGVVLHPDAAAGRRNCVAWP